MKQSLLECGLECGLLPDANRGEPLLRAGNTNCGGCGMSVTLNMLSQAVGQRNVQLVIPACCGIVTPGRFPYSAYGAPVVAATFASAAAVATGLAHVARMNGEDTRVLCFAGDGGTYDIGMATLSGAAERNEDVLYICYDNEIYGNTGGQRSSATPLGASTTTTPYGKDVQKKDILGIMLAHRVPYVASISLAHPADTQRKMTRALDAEGFRFLHVLAPCPTGWKSEPAESIELIRLAVKSGLFPVVEAEHGGDLVVNVESELSTAALEEYLTLQGRFKKSNLDPTELAAAVRRNWELLRGGATAGK
jgi:pyruvate ferredoxin oxidoreductase beta subunit/2-oxoisovalerate ferredoxin oxidoreductase beta subunit